MIKGGFGNFEIYRAHRCPHCELSKRLRDRSRALQWLAQFKENTSAIARVRNLLSETGFFATGLTKMSDTEALGTLAELLGNGSLHVHSQETHFVDFEKTTVRISSGSSKEKAFPLSERRPRETAASSTKAPVPTASLWVRLDLTQKQAAKERGRLRLFGTTGGYDNALAIASNFVANPPPANTIDVRFENVPTTASYSLIYIKSDGTKTTIVQNVPFSALNDDSLPARKAAHQ